MARLFEAKGRVAATVSTFTLMLSVGIAFATPAAATSSVLTVLSSSSYGPESDGFLYIVGEVKNTSTENVTAGSLTIGLYNAAGTQLSVDQPNIQAAELEPGEKSGFVDVVKPPTGYSHFTVLGATGTAATTSPYHSFTVTDVKDVVGANGVHDISGTVTNSGFYAVQATEVYVTFYNSAGVVVDVDSKLVGPLQPAASGTFDEHDIPATIRYSTVSTLVEGMAPAPSCSPCAPFTRLGGTTRIGTAIAVSQQAFPTSGSAKAIVLARADNFPDALAGGPLAAHVGGPLLLTPTTELDPTVAAEIQRVAAPGATVYILGGPAAIVPSVDTQLTSMGYAVQRESGANRFATAVDIANALGNPSTVFEVTGLNFPDALSGGPAAVASGAAILLTNGATQAPATSAYLAAHPPTSRYALGGPAVSADHAASAIAGADRFETSAKIAATFFGTSGSIGIATASAFPDALAAGPELGTLKAPLLLVSSTSPLDGSYASYLDKVGSTVTGGQVFGGTVAVGDDVVTDAQDVLVAAGAQ